MTKTASASSLAYESRLRRPERRRCVLTPADVVRDELTILPKKIEDLHQLGAFMFTEAAWCGQIVGEGL